MKTISLKKILINEILFTIIELEFMQIRLDEINNVKLFRDADFYRNKGERNEEN